MKKCSFITEISEEDFRKLNLKAYNIENVQKKGGYTRLEPVEVSLNKELDENIAYAIEMADEEGLEWLTYPVTVAIHTDPSKEEVEEYARTHPFFLKSDVKRHFVLEYSYLDKFMNRFKGSSTYELGMGIRHVYTTRRYFESKQDYWRVRKDETKALYRIKLSKKWLDKFVLKHKTEKFEYPYSFYPKGFENVDEAHLEISYELEKDGTWKEVSRIACLKCGSLYTYVRIDKNGNRIQK